MWRLYKLKLVYFILSPFLFRKYQGAKYKAINYSGPTLFLPWRPLKDPAVGA